MIADAGGKKKIMSILIYKQRFVNPNFITTASKNYAHIRYIATRPRVAKNDGMNHGLFGKLTPGNIEAFQDWQAVARLVYQNSKKHITMYRSIISFEEETARELLLTDQKAWQRYIENHMMTIAEKNHIRRENLQWVCALHQEKNHPHLHVCFWDTGSRVRNPYTHPAIPDGIRRQMIKETFADKIRAFGEEKNLALRELRQISDELTEEFDRHVRLMGQKRWQDLHKRLEWEETLEGMFSFEERMLETIAEKVFQIRSNLPPGGRISYQLLPPENKQEVDTLVEYLRVRVPALAAQRQRYIDSKMKMVHLYGGDESYIDQMKKKFSAEADKVIANRILGMVKKLNRLESEYRTEKHSQSRKRFYTEQMLLEMLEMLSGIADTSDRQWDGHKHLQGELSKEARKELYLKHQDKGYEH